MQYVISYESACSHCDRTNLSQAMGARHCIKLARFAHRVKKKAGALVSDRPLVSLTVFKNHRITVRALVFLLDSRSLACRTAIRPIDSLNAAFYVPTRRNLQTQQKK